MKSIRILTIALALAAAVASCKHAPEYRTIKEGMYGWQYVALMEDDESGKAKYGVVADTHHGREISIPFEYDDISWFAISDIISTVNVYACRKGSLYDLYSYDGNKMVDGVSSYEVFKHMGQGDYHVPYAKIIKDGKEYALFRSNASKIFGPYDEIHVAGPKAAFFRRGDKWGAFKINKHKVLSRREKETDCNEFIPAEYDNIYVCGDDVFDEKFAYYLCKKDGEWYTIDDSGEVCNDRYTELNPEQIRKSAGRPVGFRKFFIPVKAFDTNESDRRTWMAMEVRLGNEKHY